MKYTIALFALFFIISCNNTKKETDTISEENVSVSTSEDMNRVIEDTIDGGTMMIGHINRKGLQIEPFNEWFEENQKSHTVDSVLIDSLTPLLRDTKITAFMGTWCEDSQREIPALYKILDKADYNYKNFNLIAVSHDKDTPNGLEKGHNIEYVPTIFFVKNGDTLNRIVEYAHQTLEKDMLTILKGEAYTPAYSEE